MATFGTMKSRLELLMAAHVMKADIGKLINRVHQEEVESYVWHRLKAYTILNTVAPISAGTVSITQGQDTVTGVGTSFQTTDVGKGIRIDGDDTPLEVTARASTTSITVEKVWAKATVSGVAYSLFPLYYTMPSGWQRVLFVKRTYEVKETTQEHLNLYDPNRTSTGDQAQRWAPAGRDSSDLIRIELWPVPSAAVAYRVQGLKGHTDLSAENDRPLVPAAVIENKALHDLEMAEFKRSGDNRFFEAAQVSWVRYKDALNEAIIRDQQQYGVLRDLEEAVASRVGYDYAVLHDVEGS